MSRRCKQPLCNLNALLSDLEGDCRGFKSIVGVVYNFYRACVSTCKDLFEIIVGIIVDNVGSTCSTRCPCKGLRIASNPCDEGNCGNFIVVNQIFNRKFQTLLVVLLIIEYIFFIKRNAVSPSPLCDKVTLFDGIRIAGVYIIVATIASSIQGRGIVQTAVFLRNASERQGISAGVGCKEVISCALVDNGTATYQSRTRHTTCNGIGYLNLFSRFATIKVAEGYAVAVRGCVVLYARCNAVIVCEGGI